VPAGDRNRFWEIKAPGTNCAGSGNDRVPRIQVPPKGIEGVPGGTRRPRERGVPGNEASQGERGRRRTRQDQISH
jgi:hypothetical protein